MKKTLHKLFGFFKCSKIYTAKIDEIHVSEIDNDGSWYELVHATCTICKNKITSSHIVCPDTSFFNDVYYSTVVINHCFLKHSQEEIEKFLSNQNKRRK